jgi:hypothetical protein
MKAGHLYAPQCQYSMFTVLDSASALHQLDRGMISLVLANALARMLSQKFENQGSITMPECGYR